MRWKGHCWHFHLTCFSVLKHLHGQVQRFKALGVGDSDGSFLGSQPCSMMQWVSPGVWVGRVSSSMHPAWSYTLCEMHPPQISRERSPMWALDFDKWNTLGYGIYFCWISDLISMEQHMESRLDPHPTSSFSCCTIRKHILPPIVAS